MKLVYALLLFMVVTVSNAEESCFSCIGETKINEMPDRGEATVFEHAPASICIDTRSKEITHLSLASGEIKGFKFLRKIKAGSEFNARDYYYWESINGYSNFGFKEVLKFFVEFSDLQYLLHVAQRKSEADTARVNYNGSCRPTKWLNMK